MPGSAALCSGGTAPDAPAGAVGYTRAAAQLVDSLASPSHHRPLRFQRIHDRVYIRGARRHWACCARCVFRQKLLLPEAANGERPKTLLINQNGGRHIYSSSSSFRGVAKKSIDDRASKCMRRGDESPNSVCLSDPTALPPQTSTFVAQSGHHSNSFSTQPSAWYTRARRSSGTGDQ